MAFGAVVSLSRYIFIFILVKFLENFPSYLDIYLFFWLKMLF